MNFKVENIPFYCFYVLPEDSKIKLIVAISEKDTLFGQMLKHSIRHEGCILYCPEINAVIHDYNAQLYCAIKGYTIKYIRQEMFEEFSNKKEAAESSTGQCASCRNIAPLMTRLKECIDKFFNMLKNDSRNNGEGDSEGTTTLE